MSCWSICNHLLLFIRTPIQFVLDRVALPFEILVDRIFAQFFAIFWNSTNRSFCTYSLTTGFTHFSGHNFETIGAQTPCELPAKIVEGVLLPVISVMLYTPTVFQNRIVKFHIAELGFFFWMVEFMRIPTSLLIQLINYVINICELRLVTRFTLMEVRLNVLIKVIVINCADLAIIVIVLRLRHWNVV